MLKIGFVGAGNMGQMAHLRHYANLSDCRVVALVEPRPELARKVAARYGIERLYSSAIEMLQSEKLDGVVAPQPFDRHGQIITPLYEFGVPILTEKPLASSVQVGEAMIAALAKSNSWHMVGYHKRNDPAVVWSKAEIERVKNTGELGALKYVRITMPPGDWVSGGFDELISSDEILSPDQMIGADAPDETLPSEEFAQYISFVNFYIHQVNLLRHLLGENYRVTHADAAGVLLVAQSASGVTGTIEMSPYQTSRGWDESAFVAFENGYFQIDLPAPLSTVPGKVTASYDGDNARRITPDLAPEGAMRAQAKNFLRAIRGEIAPPCEAHEALEDLKIARNYLNLWKQNKTS